MCYSTKGIKMTNVKDLIEQVVNGVSPFKAVNEAINDGYKKYKNLVKPTGLNRNIKVMVDEPHGKQNPPDSIMSVWLNAGYYDDDMDSDMDNSSVFTLFKNKHNKYQWVNELVVSDEFVSDDTIRKEFDTPEESIKWLNANAYKQADLQY